MALRMLRNLNRRTKKKYSSTKCAFLTRFLLEDTVRGRLVQTQIILELQPRLSHLLYEIENITIMVVHTRTIMCASFLPKLSPTIYQKAHELLIPKFQGTKSERLIVQVCFHK